MHLAYRKQEMKKANVQTALPEPEVRRFDFSMQLWHSRGQRFGAVAGQTMVCILEVQSGRQQRNSITESSRARHQSMVKQRLFREDSDISAPGIL